MVSVIIALVIVPVALAALSGQKETDDIYNFRMNIDKKLALFVGGPAAAFFGFCLYGTYISGQMSPLLIVIFGGLFALSVFLILIPVKGFYDNEVRDNTLYARRWFIIRKSIPICDIERCEIHYNEMGGSIRVFAKGRKRPFCFIDLIQNNVENFCERIEKECIPLIDKSLTRHGADGNNRSSC